MSTNRIISFKELNIVDPQSENTVVWCPTCSSIEQLKHLRWTQSYLPGIRIGICAYCYNFRFIPSEKKSQMFVIYAHEPSKQILTTKIRGMLHLKLPSSTLKIFE